MGLNQTLINNLNTKKDELVSSNDQYQAKYLEVRAQRDALQSQLNQALADNAAQEAVISNVIQIMDSERGAWTTLLTNNP